ncbi:hypothetical protein F8388_014540 [Cannabis sativa]|uniref:CCHC-type domain-containing protein n=1 Tax=Cannabis sativa TaxID=3483 RepID=A0A7J6FYQ2_CANSA|nr:hypothetical protein F8388_014540 [Cannabis sativa]
MIVFDKKYLVEMESYKGDLLQVQRYVYMETFRVTTCFDIFKWSFDRSNWEEISDLGDEALFVGDNSSVSVDTSLSSTKCQNNCIYFTNDYSVHSNINNPSDMGVYNLVTRSVRRFNIDTNLFTRMGGRAPIWIVPNISIKNYNFGATKLTGKRSPFTGKVQSMVTGDVVLHFASFFLRFSGLGCDFLGLLFNFLRFTGCCGEFIGSFFWNSSWQFVLGSAAIRGVYSMDLELVNRLSEILVLDEGDGPVLSLNKAGIEEGKKKMDLCLVGKVIGPRPANKEGIEKAMNGVWKIHHRFQVEELSSKNVFRFFFGCREDRQGVYGGGPWTIDKQLICFVKPMGLGKISKMNFDFTSFWISINNVPLACMTELFAREWGERIRKLEDIKIVNGTMKVRVRINITEPLKRGLCVAIDDQGNEVSLLFQYEHLPDFCFDCGIIGHKALDCPLQDFGGVNPNFDSGRYGSWMCAPSSPPRDRSRNRVRYSGPTLEELAPTSVLEARERDEELASKANMKEKAPVVAGVHSEVTGSELGRLNGDPMVSEEVLLPSSAPSVCMPVVGLVMADNASGKEQLGKVSSSDVDGGSTSGKVDGVGDPKLSHVIVANAKCKVSLKVGGGGKRKMEMDVNSARQCFTWLNKRQGGAHVQERLDRYFCNQEWHNLYPSVRVLNGDLIHSDHRPVVASLENDIRHQQNDRKRCFRFETHWLKDDDCHDIVQRTWLAPEVSSPLDNQDCILDIFGRCADQLGAWNKGKFGSISRLVRETQKQLDDLLSVSAPLVRMDEVKRLETKLNDLLSREECYWKLRSRADWLALGDRNTKYFHNKATGRKKKIAIVEIMTEDGRKLSTEEDIVSEIE